MNSEFEFIKNLRQKISPSFVKMGIGDDCAVIPKDKKTDLVITTDLLVEDIDFRRQWMIPKLLGHKALAVSLSDIAAMGAKPVWAMISIGIPIDIWKTDFVDKFYRGWFELGKKFNVELIGGDVSKTPDKIIIDSIVAGEVKANKAIMRSNAKVGDLIFVTGELGGAAKGLELLEQGILFDTREKNNIQKLILRQLQPNPQLEIAEILQKNSLATSMIDLSDGISGDLKHICDESQVGAELFLDRIPIDKNLDFNDESLNLALNGGEDFELLFTVNPENRLKLEKKLKNFSATEIGKITSKKCQIFATENNNTNLLLSSSYNHF